MSPPLLPPKMPTASPDEWELHKDYISYLYHELDKPLKEVADIMRVKHDFHATQKMYKYRFRLWGLRKYLSADEYSQIRHESAIGADIRLPVVRGRELGSKRLKLSVATDNRLRRALGISCSPSIEVPGHITPPDALHSLENILHAMKSYTTSQFEKREWRFADYDPEQSLTCSWWHGMNFITQRMVEKHDVGANFYLLDQCCAGYRTLLRLQDPLLLWGTFIGLMELSFVGNDIAMSFAKFASELCTIELGNFHPMTILLRTILKVGVGNQNLCHTAITVCDAQFDVFCNNISVGDQFWPLYARLMVRSLAGADITMSPDTIARLNRMIQWNNRNPGPDMKKYERLFASTHSFLAIMYIRAGRYPEAGHVLCEIERCNNRSQSPSFYIPVNIAELRGNKDERAGKFSSAEDHLTQALTLLLEMEPTKKRQTRLAVAYKVLESFYCRRGDKEAVRRVRQEHEDQLKVIMNGPIIKKEDIASVFDESGTIDSKRLSAFVPLSVPPDHDIHDMQCYPGYQISQTGRA